MPAAKQTQAGGGGGGTGGAVRAQSNGKLPATLAEALVAIQAEAPTIPLDSTNPHFKSRFASLAGVMDKVRPVTSKNGVAVIQKPTTLDGQPALTTKLLHVSGECEEDTMLLLPAKADPQGQGSALTYGRRYMALAMLGLVGDEDDDANAASQSSGQSQPQAKPADQDTISGEQINALGKGIRAVGVETDRLKLLFGSIGAEAPETDSSEHLRSSLSKLTPAQGDQLGVLLDAEASRGE